MRKRSGQENLSEQLRRIIRSEPSCYDLAERAGVSRSTLTRFLKCERGLTTDTLDRLAAVLRLRIIAGR
jgi:transcriptional regulator with XRE-family HTH domain